MGSFRLARDGVISPHVVHLAEAIGFHESGGLCRATSRPTVQKERAGFVQSAHGVLKIPAQPVELFGAGPRSRSAFTGRSAIDDCAVGGIQLGFELLGRQVAFGHKEHDFLVKDTRLRRCGSKDSAKSHTGIIWEVPPPCAPYCVRARPCLLAPASSRAG